MSRKQPELLRYYLDANIDGPDVMQALRDAAMPCEAHRDHFASDAEDETWIPEIAARKWIIVTRDLAIRRRPTERAAWMNAGAAVVMVRGVRLTAEDIANTLLAAHADGRLDNFIDKRVRPMIIYVHPNGRIEVHEGGERRGGRKKDK